MRPVTLNPGDPVSSLREIERASHEGDIVELAQNFSVGNTPAAQRALLGSNVQLSAAGVGNGNDSTEDTLFTYTLPASSLTLVGQGLSLLAAGTLANNAHTKSVRLYFGASMFFVVNTTLASAVWLAHMRVYRSASKAQLILADGQAGTSLVTPAIFTGANDDTTALTLKVTGQSGSSGANDVVANIFAVDGLPSDIGNTFATWIADCQKGGMNRTT
jgi:hypothetical protein